MSTHEHPYKNLPNKAFWRRAVASIPLAEVDPVGQFSLRLTSETRVATAGSCFAQHIARHLRASGFNYYVTERAHPIVGEKIGESHNYGTFSARYGNLYTSRQLLQLIQRAYGEFAPTEDIWLEADGTAIDPFRPTVQPGGFSSEVELREDRRQHLAAVRHMFETLEVFVFTLGLTECWQSRTDGAVFPLCPGVEGGSFNPAMHVFANLTVREIEADLCAFCDALRAVNPGAQIVLTVSPVPLMATAQDDAHVLAATTYSKAVLRVAAEEVCRQKAGVHYFPSFEIITGAYARGVYYASDLRSVTEQGVEHVMRVFFRHVAGVEKAMPAALPDGESAEDSFLKSAELLIEVECDEVALDRDAGPSPARYDPR